MTGAFGRRKAQLLGFWARHQRALMFGFSLLSLVWGVISGISLTRNYAQSTRLLAYLALFLFSSVLFRIWLEYAQRRQADAQRGVTQFMLARPQLVEGVAHFATQYAVAYIAMFCLPLLFLAQAWMALGVALVLAVISLVDPWWVYVARRPLLMAAVRCAGAVLTVSFAFAVFLPRHLEYFHACLVVVALLSAGPWEWLLERRRPSQRELGRGLVVALVIGLTSTVQHRWGVPLLSVWLDHPAIGTRVEDHALQQSWEGHESRTTLAAAAASQEPICCFTPVVSPSGVASVVTHEWLVNGEVIDRIELPKIRGVGKIKGVPFRTFSCKQHLPATAVVERLGCRVYIDQHIFLGEVAVQFD